MADPRREMLEEQFTDAALHLLLEDYSEAEGRALLKRYGQSPQEMPEALQNACRMQIQTVYKKSQKRMLLRRAACRAAKIAAALAVVISLSANLILSVEAIRVPCLNFCIRVTGYFTELNFSGKRASEEPRTLPFYAPEGYTLVMQDHNYDDFAVIRRDSMLFYGYRAEDGSIFSIESMPAAGSITFDTEDSESVTFFLNGMKAVHIVKANAKQSILWLDESRERICKAFCTNMDKEEFLTHVMVLSVDLMDDALYDY